MSQVLTYRGMTYTAPKDTSGLLSHAPTGPRPSARMSEASLVNLIEQGGMFIRSMAAANGHGSIVPLPVVEGGLADQKKRELDDYYTRELNKRKNPKAILSAQSSSVHHVHAGSFQRGDKVIHVVTNTRLTVLGTSKSKPGFLKVVSASGDTFRVSPKNLTYVESK